MFISDIKNVLNKWLFKQSKEWLVNLPYELIIAVFLSNKDGMNCQWHKKYFDEILRLCQQNRAGLKLFNNPVLPAKFCRLPAHTLTGLRFWRYEQTSIKTSSQNRFKGNRNIR